MKVLFLGEYSGVFTELRKSLESKGVTCVSINDGDGWKNFPADYRLKSAIAKNNSRASNIVRELSFRLGLKGFVDFIRHWGELKKHIKGFDVVQIVNPIIYGEWGALAHILLLNYLRKNNNAIFLSVLGDDYYTVKWIRKHNKKSKRLVPTKHDVFIHPSSTFMYELCVGYHLLNYFATKVSKSIIPGLLQYKNSYLWTGKTNEICPFPINEKLITDKPLKISDGEKIVIFHGWQKARGKFKGNDVYDRVICRLKNNYPDLIEYVVVQNVPYSEYIKLYNSCHIYIDQLYGNDKGVNATLGMAAGKVVFTGAEDESLRAYPFYDGNIPCINASCNEEKLYKQLESLIKNPSQMEMISKNAIEFVKRNHSADFVADLYMKCWKKFC